MRARTLCGPPYALLVVMRVLITWGSKRGGTEGLARMIGKELVAQGVEVELAAAHDAVSPKGFDAVIVGGALYANRWHRHARRWVRRHERELSAVPVWFFSSGPLDDSARSGDIAPTRHVETLMERVGAQSHMTFGGRMDPKDPSPLAKSHAGDWRDPEHVRAWSVAVARALPVARPRPVVPQPARSLGRLLLHAVVGWAACAAAMGTLLTIASVGVALTVHAILAPLVFVFVARHYFQPRGGREPITVALSFAAIVALLDLTVVAGAVLRSTAMFESFAGTWLPLALIFLVTYATGELMSTMPWTTHPHLEPHAKGT